MRRCQGKGVIAVAEARRTHDMISKSAPGSEDLWRDLERPVWQSSSGGELCGGWKRPAP